MPCYQLHYVTALQGAAYSYGLEPGFLGSLAFYAAGWEYREGPVQLTALLASAHGLAELEEFRLAWKDMHLLRPKKLFR